MKNILSLVLLMAFYFFIFGCARTEGQPNTTSAPVKNETTQKGSVQSKSTPSENTQSKSAESNKAQNSSEQNKNEQTEPVPLKDSQARIKELAAKLGLQSIRPVALVDFELADLKGQMHKLSSYKGKVIFLNFWATWCPPCKSEMPDMQKLYESFKNKNWQMLAVNLQEPTTTVASFMKSRGFTFPVLLDSKGRMGSTYGAESIPLTILINKKGNLIYGAMGARPWAAPEVMELLQLLIDQPE